MVQVKPPRLLAVLNENAGRACGTCTACCTAGAVPELAKAAGYRCDNERTSRTKPGCKIYPDRPQSCRDFRCLWLEGVGPERARPDRLGVFLAVREHESLPVAADVPGALGKQLNGHRRALIAVETRPNGATEAKQELDAARAVAPLLVIPWRMG